MYPKAPKPHLCGALISAKHHAKATEALIAGAAG